MIENNKNEMGVDFSNQHMLYDAFECKSIKTVEKIGFPDTFDVPYKCIFLKKKRKQIYQSPNS